MVLGRAQWDVNSTGSRRKGKKGSDSEAKHGSKRLNWNFEIRRESSYLIPEARDLKEAWKRPAREEAVEARKRSTAAQTGSQV